MLGLVQLGQAIDRERALGIELQRALVRDDGTFGVIEHVSLGLADAAPHAGPFAVVLIRQAIRTLHLDQNYEWIIIGGALIVAVVIDQSGARLLRRRLARDGRALA